MIWTLLAASEAAMALQTASEVRSDLRFEISDINYLLIDVHIACMVWALLTTSEATTASKQLQRPNPTSDLKLVTSITYAKMVAQSPNASCS